MQITTKERIKSVVDELESTSFAEKKAYLSQEEITNKFLDGILELKAFLTAKTNQLQSITNTVESLTWCKDVNDEELQQLNKALASAKDLRSSLIKTYISISRYKALGIAKEEINNFKAEIDDFTSAYKEVEYVFFYLPSDTEINNITNDLLGL